MGTILLIVISHTTNYFKPFFFEAIVSVNLTVMLVLATMFIAVSENLPKTSYIKMVDIWLIFNLMIPFFEVLLHTFIDSLRIDESREINHHGQTRKVGDENVEVSAKDNLQDVIHVGEKVQLKEEAPASVPGGKYDLNLVARNEKAKVNTLKNYYEEHDGGEQKLLRQAVMVGQWGVPAL